MPRKKTEYTASQIVELVDKKRSSTAYNELFTQMENDFDLFALKPYQAEEGHQSYTSPKPKNDFEKVLNGINKASLTWNICVPEDAPQEEREAANKGEKILTGIINQADEQLSSNGEPNLRQGSGWLACARGALGMICLIYNNAKKDTVIDIRYIDPLHMVWEKGVHGYAWMSYEYNISKTEAEELYDKEFTTDEVRVIVFFDRKINAVVLVEGSDKENSQFAKKPTPHGLDHVPMWLEFAGSMPTIFNKSNQLQLKYRANSVYASSRNVYEPFNKQVSFIMDTAEKSVAGTLVYESEDGTKSIQGDPYANWQVVRIKKDKESLHPLEAPKVPPESAVILGVIDKDLNQSTVPYPIGYGIDPQAHSGSALAMINDNTRSIYDPFTSLMERAWKWLCKEILVQFKAKGQKINLKGFNQDGKFWAIDASPDDIRDDWYIQVKCEPKLPRDEFAELQMGLAARQPDASGQPLLSDYTIREKVIKLPNPDAEQTRIDEQILKRKIESIPEYTLRKMALAMLKAGDMDGAQLFLSKLMQAQGGPASMATPGPSPQAGQIPQLTPQQLEEVAQMAAQLQAQGKPIPPEMRMALQQAQNMPAPQ